MGKHPLALIFILVWICLSPWAPALASDESSASESWSGELWLPNLARDYYGLAVDTQDRQESQEFYDSYFLPSTDVKPQWTGNYAACDAGTTSDAFRAAVRMRINYVRAMAGVPADMVLSEEFNRKAQQAALMMSVNGELDHTPPEDWTCYTADGATAAGHSNLFLGPSGAEAILGYVEDPGENNYFVGHRRWILCPQLQAFGTGDVPGAGDGRYQAANARWVIDPEHIWDQRPPTRDGFVAWPPPGYVPGPLVFPRWSFSYADADFADAEVHMRNGEADIAVTVEPPVDGYCENTLVWEPGVDWRSLDITRDRTFTVDIRNVLLDGQRRSYTYTVTIFAP